MTELLYPDPDGVDRPANAPDDESCAGCHYAQGAGLIACVNQHSKHGGHLIYLESWCSQFVPKKAPND